MLAKIAAFVLLGLGMVVVLGYVSVAVPSLHHQAITIGEHIITWFKITCAAGLGAVFMLASRV